MVKPGKTVPSLKKPLGLEMKGSPYPMTASQENTFGKDGTNPNPGVYNGIKAADAKSEGPEFIGALVGGALIKGIGGAIAKKAIGGAIAKTATKTLAGKALSAIGGAAKTAVSGIGEGIGGVAEGLKEKVGGGGKGAFKEKVKNYVGSLDLITNSSPDGSLKQNAPSTSEDSDKNITNTEADLGDMGASSRESVVGSDLKMPSLSLDQTAGRNSIPEQAGVKDLSKLPGMNMEGPLNKLKKMCRG